MQQQTDSYFYTLRFLLAGIFTVAFLVLISALVTVIGSGGVLDARKGSSARATAPSISIPDSPNAVTDFASTMVGNTQHISLVAGTAIYGACRSITYATTHSGASMVHASAVIGRGIGNGAAVVGRGGSGLAHGVGSVVIVPLRVPGRIIGSINHTRTVSALIRPADSRPVPVIDAETSSAVLARLGAQQKQQVAGWLAAQVAANQGLGGSIVAGDIHHGGYPTRWDNAAQDSQLDNWGMYSRECVSYTAWKVYQTYGNMPYWGGVGNANQWVRDAKTAGIATGSTAQVHSVAISMHGYYGHAMWVEAVSGNMVYVSQYNYDLQGHYSEMWVNGNNFTYIYFK